MMQTADAIAYLRGIGPLCSPSQLSKAIGGHPYSFNMAAKNGQLDYDHTWSGCRLRIYTESVIRRLSGERGGERQ